MTTKHSDPDPRFTYSESIYVDASPQTVWDVVTDIERTGSGVPFVAHAGGKSPRPARKSVPGFTAEIKLATRSGKPSLR